MQDDLLARCHLVQNDRQTSIRTGIVYDMNPDSSLERGQNRLETGKRHIPAIMNRDDDIHESTLGKALRCWADNVSPYGCEARFQAHGTSHFQTRVNWAAKQRLPVLCGNRDQSHR